MSEHDSPFAPPPPAPPAAEPVLQTTQVQPGWSDPVGQAAATVRTGSLVGRAFATWRSCLLPFCLLGALDTTFNLVAGWLLGSPFQLLEASPFAPPSPEARAWSFSAGYWAYSLCVLLSSVLLMGALTEGALQRLAGRTVTVGGMLRAMVGRAPALLGAGALAWLFTYLGLLLLIVPGIMWGLSFSLVAPVVMAERLGVVASLKRSAALAKGSRWRLLGTYFICMLVASLPTLLGMGLGLAVPMAGGLIMLLGGVVTGPLIHVAPAVAWHDLRVAKEGAQTEELARVFE